YDRLDPERQAALRARLVHLMRTNRYDGSTGVLTIDPVRAHAFDANQAHYATVFGDGRADYAIPRGTLTDPERLHALGAFFFWTAWAAATDRPGTDFSYTSNWPYEPLVDNLPTSENIVWTGVSIIILLTGLGGGCSP